MSFRRSQRDHPTEISAKAPTGPIEDSHSRPTLANLRVALQRDKRLGPGSGFRTRKGDRTVRLLAAFAITCASCGVESSDLAPQPDAGNAQGQIIDPEVIAFYLRLDPKGSEFYYVLSVFDGGSDIFIGTNDECVARAGPHLVSNGENAAEDQAFIQQVLADAVRLGALEFAVAPIDGECRAADSHILMTTEHNGDVASLTVTASSSQAWKDILAESEARIMRVLRVGEPFRESDAELLETEPWSRAIPLE